MAAAVAMVVSSPHRDDRPKLAPKPSLAKQLAVQQSPEPPPPPLRSPISRPKFFEQKERANAAEGGNDKWSDSAHRSCVNETAACKECRNADTAGIVNVILRRGRRAKAPKPLPYLEPIVTYLARSANQSSEGRQKRVTFAAPSSARSLRSRQNRVARANSEKLSRGRRRELAYLVVDLQSGTISSCSGKHISSVACLETYDRPLSKERMLGPVATPDAVRAPLARCCTTYPMSYLGAYRKKT